MALFSALCDASEKSTGQSIFLTSLIGSGLTTQIGIGFFRMSFSTVVPSL
jgi:hypothetical protein